MSASTRRRFRFGMFAAAIVAASACGGGSDTVNPPNGSSSTTSSSAIPPTELPGTPSDFGPAAGGIVAVVGVASDDVLNVHSAPGESNTVVAALSPTATASATGSNRQLPDGSIWYEVEIGGTTGWASSRFLLGLGGTQDVTAGVIAKLGTTPRAATMLELGRIVADSQASADVPSRIVVVVAPTVGDLGEVTFDVIGLADDSVGGVRLHVFGQPDRSSEGFGLKSVEATDLCYRSFGPLGELCA